MDRRLKVKIFFVFALLSVPIYSHAREIRFSDASGVWHASNEAIWGFLPPNVFGLANGNNVIPTGYVTLGSPNNLLLSTGNYYRNIIRPGVVPNFDFNASVNWAAPDLVLWSAGTNCPVGWGYVASQNSSGVSPASGSRALCRKSGITSSSKIEINDLSSSMSMLAPIYAANQNIVAWTWDPARPTSFLYVYTIQSSNFLCWPWVQSGANYAVPVTLSTGFVYGCSPSNAPILTTKTAASIPFDPNLDTGGSARVHVQLGWTGELGKLSLVFTPRNLYTPTFFKVKVMYEYKQMPVTETTCGVSSWNISTYSSIIDSGSSESDFTRHDVGGIQAGTFYGVDNYYSNRSINIDRNLTLLQGSNYCFRFKSIGYNSPIATIYAYSYFPSNFSNSSISNGETSTYKEDYFTTEISSDWEYAPLVTTAQDPYTDSSVRIKTTSGVEKIATPSSQSSCTSQLIKVKTLNGLVCLKLVPTTDPNASKLRVRIDPTTWAVRKLP